MMESKENLPVATDNRELPVLAPNRMLFLSDDRFDALVANWERNVKKRDELIQNRLVPEVDFYAFEGGKKHSLSKAGAESLVSGEGGLFPTEPQSTIVSQIEDWDKGLFSYTIHFVLKDGEAIVGDGLGVVSTFDPKYRYIWIPEWEAKKRKIDTSHLPCKEKTSKKGKKYKSYRIQREVSDLIGLRNTVIKMAKKSAYIDATLNATGASRYMTQDLEDLHASGLMDGEPVDAEYEVVDDKPKPTVRSAEIPDDVPTVIKPEFLVRQWCKDKDVDYVDMAKYIVGQGTYKSGQNEGMAFDRFKIPVDLWENGPSGYTEPTESDKVIAGMDEVPFDEDPETGKFLDFKELHALEELAEKSGTAFRFWLRSNFDIEDGDPVPRALEPEIRRRLSKLKGAAE